MQFTIRESTGGWRRHVLAAIVLGLLLAFLGPFGSQASMSPGLRALFWLSLVGTGYLLALAAARLIGPRPQKVILRTISIALLSGLPQTFIVSWALVQVRPSRVITIGNLPMLFLAVVAVQGIIVAIQAWTSSEPNNDLPSLAAGEETGPRAGGRVPQSLRADLVALESEDHYVRIHHKSGSTLILHRFSDAIAELDSREGLQVHRSWWVASGAVAGSFIRSGKRWLKLSNGMEIPVSRTHLRRVVEQNWPRVVAPVSDEA
ncbi:LytTR family DNA-binding domain-containing protein [Sphingomonas hankyongi]|uniref:LytTR family transcriptional regulator n=1 Tax=Sphingomonas hankyongi TaxID=2908209 RepID=A0ABT0S3I1_9SPHN|nr:LytTR family DNA-binding domain-containing protein [Sphingomonas hankyongi]MCL6730424.1 LytTR family transcriptional regulator [Sphingomonas hankyongi]